MFHDLPKDSAVGGNSLICGDISVCWTTFSSTIGSETSPEN